MKVGLATYDWLSVRINGVRAVYLQGPGWIRLGQNAANSQLTTALGILVWDTASGTFGIQEPDGTTHFDCPVIVASRPMRRSDPDQIKEAVSNGQIFAIDADDWYWGLMPENPAYQKSHPDCDSEYNTDHLRLATQYASALIVSTPFLLDRIDWVDTDKKYLHENYLDFGQFTQRQQQESSKPTIGWTGYTSYHTWDLELLKEVYPSVIDEFCFHHTGDHGETPPFADCVGLPLASVRTMGAAWTGEYQQKGFQFDIGVVPLADLPFNDAKSWLKGIEYAAAGVPFVASPTREYVRLHDTYGVGRLADQPADWVEHLRALKEGSVRKQEAAENLERLKPLDISVGVRKWESLIESLV